MKRTIIFIGNFCVKISSLCAFYSTFQWIKKKTNMKHWETTFFFLERIFNLKNEKILLYFFLNMFFQIFYSFSYSNKNQYYCTFLLCFQSEMLALRKKKPIYVYICTITGHSELEMEKIVLITNSTLPQWFWNFFSLAFKWKI